MKKPSVEIIKRILNENSLNKLIDIYGKDWTSLSVFSKKTWLIISFLSIIFFVYFLISISTIPAFISVTVLCFSVYKISEINNYKKGALDGLESGFESGQITFGLTVFSRDNIEEEFYNQLAYKLNDCYANTESKQYEIIKYLNNKTFGWDE